MNDYTGERDEIRKWVATAVQEHWEAQGRAYLLSALGLRLRKTFPTSSLVIPEGLREFLTAFPIVQVVSHPVIKEKIGAIPLNAHAPSDPSELFLEAQARTQVTREYFYSEFWKAFHRPLIGRRFVVVHKNQKPEVIEGVDVPPSSTDVYEVIAEDVVSLPYETPMPEKIRAVAVNIDRWLQRHSLSREAFTDRAYKSARRTSLREGAGSHLASALARLDASDQARIFVPLDIVSKMLSED